MVRSGKTFWVIKGSFGTEYRLIPHSDTHHLVDLKCEHSDGSVKGAGDVLRVDLAADCTAADPE